MERLVSLVSNMCRQRIGHYLIAFPSYAYLQDFAAQAAFADTSFFYQQPGQDRAALNDLLESFKNASSGLLAIVMGGVLGESMNFDGVRLQGVFVVSIALPPPTAERDLRATYFDEQESRGWGQRIAYTQPALSKIQQAAGRLIRDEQDRGIICLIDPRFLNAEIKQFQPAHWQVQAVNSTQAIIAAEEFWQGQESSAH